MTDLRFISRSQDGEHLELSDGVTRRIKIPSWDDIMFGRGKKKDEQEEE